MSEPREGRAVEPAVADDAAVAGEYRHFEAESPPGDRVLVHVPDLEGDPERTELGDEIVAQRAAGSAVDDEAPGRHPAPRQSRRFAAAAGRASCAVPAGRIEVAMYLSVRGGTSPTAVT
jgi:hypothetical protein